MPVGLKKQSSRVSDRSISRANRLKELSDEAGAIRAKHAKGEISSAEARKSLAQLKQRYRNFIDRVLEVY